MTFPTNDPELICMIGDHPQCGKACLPIEEYTPLIERIVFLETRHQELIERLAKIAVLCQPFSCPPG